MFSLTRRSAMSMSKSLQNINVSINIDEPKEMDRGNGNHNEEYNNNLNKDTIIKDFDEPLREEMVRSRTSSTADHYQSYQRQPLSQLHQQLHHTHLAN